MQRLHENDLTGMLLELEPNEWEHVCLPAELSPSVKPNDLSDFYVDSLLFNQRLSQNVLDSFKIGLGTYGYSGQYQFGAAALVDMNLIDRKKYNKAK